MGTNYYLHKKTCPCCKKAEEILHIGKSSGGWCFSLHIIPNEGIHDLADWLPLINDPGHIIKNEYDEVVEAQEMIDCITSRTGNGNNQDPYGYRDWNRFHRDNHSQDGPGGLLRHALGQYCTKHGEGTWDCLPGEFS